MSKLGRYAALLFYPIVGIAALFCTLFIAIDGMVNKTYSTNIPLVAFLLTEITGVLLSVFLLNMSRKCYRMETRHIEIDQYGFTIRDRNDSRYAWEAIRSIGMIVYAANASKDIYQTEICIFLEPFGDKDLRKLRDSYLYGAFNLNRFVLLDYDSHLIDQLIKCSGLPINDFQSAQMKL